MSRGKLYGIWADALHYLVLRKKEAMARRGDSPQMRRLERNFNLQDDVSAIELMGEVYDPGNGLNSLSPEECSRMELLAKRYGLNGSCPITSAFAELMDKLDLSRDKENENHGLYYSCPIGLFALATKDKCNGSRLDNPHPLGDAVLRGPCRNCENYINH